MTDQNSGGKSFYPAAEGTNYTGVTSGTQRGAAAGMYRKKPVVIEARQLAGSASDVHDVYLWIEANTLGSFEPMEVIEGRVPYPASGVSIDPRDGRIIISTLEGLHWADPGDWIIRGVQGEFYPCKPDIFKVTHMPVDRTPESDDRHAVDYGRPETGAAKIVRLTAERDRARDVAVLLEGEVEKLREEIASSRQVSDMYKAFHDLVVKERNYERLRVDRRTAEVERLRSGLRYIIELLGEDPDEHPHVSPIDLIAVKVAYLRGRDDALAEREAAEAGEPGE